MSAYSPTTIDHDTDHDNMRFVTIQPLVDQVEQAIQSGQFNVAIELLEEAFTTDEALGSEVRLLAYLGEAYAEQQNFAQAAQVFQRAYEVATGRNEQSRLFQLTCQAYRQGQDFAAILRLAERQLEYVTGSRERADCLLVAGEALVRLRRYREARERYLQPASKMADSDPASRAYLWNYLGFCAVVEHEFSDALEAFRKSNEFGLALQYERRAVALPWQRAELHHLRNTAHFYTGVIHLIDQRPQLAIQALEAVQPPLQAERQLNTTVYQALAWLRLHQREAAEHALQPLARASDVPDSARAPYAVVCAGLANRHESLETVGGHLEAAIGVSLDPRSSWEPSWRALLYEEVGLALLRAGYREASIACVEESLKVALDRIYPWDDGEERDWLRGPSLLAALDNLPVVTWSRVVRSELFNPLQTLAWLYHSKGNHQLADIALNFALRIALNSEQRGAIWLQRGWLAAMGPTPIGRNEGRDEVVLGVQAAQAMDVSPDLSDALRGIEALLRGDSAQALTCFEMRVDCPEMAQAQAICLAGWIWAQAQHGRLEPALADAPLADLLAWRSH